MRTIIILSAILLLALSCKKQSNSIGVGTTLATTNTTLSRYAFVEFSLLGGDSAHWIGKYYINGYLQQTMASTGCMISDWTDCSSHQNSGMNSYGTFTVNIGDLITATIYNKDSLTCLQQDAVTISLYATNPNYISSSNTKGLVVVKSTPNFVNVKSASLTYTIK